jgi:hypothetical protein
MDVMWGLKQVLEAAEQHKEQLAPWLRRGWEYLFGKPFSIAFTGMQGVGKTALLDQLTGAASRPGYQQPLQSQAKESGTVRTAKSRILISVVPGQSSYPRYVALQDVFSGKEPVQGVVHIVSWGHATIRTREAAESLLHDKGADTIEKVRGLHLKSEEEDLAETCQHIRAAHHKHRAPTWLILAVDKVDLYLDQIDKAREWYASQSGPCGAILAELQQQLGADYFRWESVPVCACLERFEWNGQELHPQLDEQGRDAYLAQLLRCLASYCKA